MNTGLVDRLDRPPGMMFDASTSSPDKSSMTSEFSESESTVSSSFCFLSFFVSSSADPRPRPCSRLPPVRVGPAEIKSYSKVVGFSIIAFEPLCGRIVGERERDLIPSSSSSSSSSSKRCLCAPRRKQREQKDERTNAAFSQLSHLLFFLDFFGRSPSIRTLALQ